MSTAIGSNSTITPKGLAARERIYAASIRLMQGGAYENLTVPAICAAAGVSVGAFYHHFESKSDILLRYVSDESDLLLSYYKGLEALSRKEALLKSVEYFFNFFAVKGRAFVTAFLGIIFSTGGEYYDLGGFSIVSIIEDALGRGAAAGEFRPVTEDTVSLARGVILDLMVAWCVKHRSASADGAGELAAAGCARMRALLELLKAG